MGLDEGGGERAGNEIYREWANLVFEDGGFGEYSCRYKYVYRHTEYVLRSYM